MLKNLISAVVAALWLMIGAAAHADPYAGPSFSGIAYYTENGTAAGPLGPVHVDRAGFRMNMETEGQRIGSLIRWNEQFAYSLMLDQRMYMKVPGTEIGMDEYEARPCVGYKDSRKIGEETVDGRITEKWRCTDELSPAQGETPADATIWYDPELAFEIKAVSDDGSEFEIREITVGRQDPKLFEIPAGFQEFDMNAMMGGQQQ